MENRETKILIVILLACISVTSFAKNDWFKFGIKGGINFSSVSHFELGYISESVTTYTGFNAGLAFSFSLPVQGMTLQPEINYVSKGAMFHGSGIKRFRVDYIEIPVNLQYGLDLVLLRPYLMLSPYVGYAVNKSPSELDWNFMNRFEYGIGIGGGLDFWRIQLQIQYNWNIGKLVRSLATTDDLSANTKTWVTPNNMLSSIKNGNFRGFEVSIIFFF